MVNTGFLHISQALGMWSLVIVTLVQGSYTFWPMDFQDFSMTLNQIFITKLKSRY